MAYRVFDHTADLGVEATATTLGEVYAETGLALFDLMADRSTIRTEESRELAVTGGDAADLLVNFLRELLNAFNGDGFLVKDCVVSGVDSRGLQASLRGEQFDPSRHRIAQEIKAVTYHQASVEQTEDGAWKARVVFDV